VATAELVEQYRILIQNYQPSVLDMDIEGNYLPYVKDALVSALSFSDTDFINI